MPLLFPPQGPVTTHIKQSYGGSRDPFNHYGTVYNINYGKTWVHRDLYREPRPGGNFMWSKRCVLGYNERLDDYDNKFLKPLIKTNFLSVTHRDFTGRQYPYNTNSFNDTFKPILPKGYCLATSLTDDPNKHNPNDWKTTYNREYNNKPPKSIDITKPTIGQKEPSGFVLNTPTVNTLSGEPHSTFRNDWPMRPALSRPTGLTLYSTNYRPYAAPTGDEPIPNITPRSDMSSGYVKCNEEKPKFIPSTQEVPPPKTYRPEELEKLKKTDPAEYFNAIYPNKDPSVTHATYKDPGKIEPTKAEILNKVHVGDKENTGYVSNQETYLPTEDYPSRFVTTYMKKYYDPTVIGPERNGHEECHVLDIQSDGYVKNNGVKSMAGRVTVDNCTYPDAYQIRSFNARDYVAELH